MPNVNPEILVWARQTAGLSLHDAAKGILSDTRKRTGEQALQDLEAGMALPTTRTLEQMARKYHRPLLVFYLDAPPSAGNRGRDFRRAAGANTLSYEPNLDALIRDVRARQSVVRSVLEDDESPTVPFVGSITTDTDVDEVVTTITRVIGFDLRTFRAQTTADRAFAYLRSQIEKSGVFVMLAGNLGSHHSNIAVKMFRGFAMADDLAPFIVINDQDARAAWSFTATHELVHILLGETGVSGYSDDLGVERFCNDVAGRLLLPERGFSGAGDANNGATADVVRVVSEYADQFNVSNSMVAYRMFLSGAMSRDRWAELSRLLRERWQRGQDTEARAAKPSGGPDYYVVRRHRLGSALIALVRRSLMDGTITYTRAGRVLRVKTRNVEPMVSGVSGLEAS